MPEGPECKLLADNLHKKFKGTKLTNIEKVIKAIKKNEPLLIKNFVDNVYKGEIKQLISELNKCNNLEYNPNET